MPSFVKTIGLPVYYDERSCYCETIASPEETKMAVCEALCNLGCETIREEKQSNIIIGDRKFYIGFFCGLGGETISVRIQKVKEAKLITIISYKRSPYLVAPEFLHEQFRSQFEYYLLKNKEISGEN